MTQLELLNKYLEELKVIKKTKLDNPKKKRFITADPYDCELNNGEVIYREQLKKNGLDGSAVIVLPVTIDNEVIVSVEPRVFTERTVGVGFPAGYIEDGEEAYQAALRELQEEVGCVPEYLVKLSSFYQDEGISAAKNTAFLAVGCREGFERHPDEGENIEYVKLRFMDVVKLEEEGLIEGSNSVIAIMKAKDYIDEFGKVKMLKVRDNCVKIK